jgi:hypothetical protein
MTLRVIWGLLLQLLDVGEEAEHALPEQRRGVAALSLDVRCEPAESAPTGTWHD